MSMRRMARIGRWFLVGATLFAAGCGEKAALSEAAGETAAVASPGTPDVAQAPKREPMELVFVKAPTTLTVEGRGPKGAKERILKEMASTELSTGCGLAERQVTATELDDVEAPPAWRETLVVSILCGRHQARLVLREQPDLAGAVLEGRMSFAGETERAKVADELKDMLELVDGLESRVEFVRDPTLMPKGYGRLKVIGGIAGKGLTFKRLGDEGAMRDELGNPVDTEITVVADWVGAFPEGIWAGDNGEHVAIVAGRTTWFRSGNKAAATIAGLRFPLDDEIPFVGLNDEGAMNFDDPKIIATCTSTAGQPCFGPRFLMPGVVWEVAKGAEGLLKHRSVIEQLMLHADLVDDADKDFRMLRGRGLSTHFHLGFDGKVHQFLDVAYCGYHGGEPNNRSIGIDLGNEMANLVRTRNAPAYSKKHPRLAETPAHPRPLSDVGGINKAKVHAWGYTDAQYRSLASLARLMTSVFPAVARTVPRGPDGAPIWEVMEDPGAFKGTVAHYH
jgi:hypothetical protein